jgi:hypothetical protein
MILLSVPAAPNLNDADNNNQPRRAMEYGHWDY